MTYSYRDIELLKDGLAGIFNNGGNYELCSIDSNGDSVKKLQDISSSERLQIIDKLTKEKQAADDEILADDAARLARNTKFQNISSKCQSGLDSIEA